MNVDDSTGPAVANDSADGILAQALPNGLGDLSNRYAVGVFADGPVRKCNGNFHTHEKDELSAVRVVGTGRIELPTPTVSM